MEIVNKDELLEFTPDIELASTKGLADDGELNEIYFRLQAIYAKLLNIYLNNKLGIFNIVNSLNIDGFKPSDEKDQYQLLSNNKYFFVRNNLYVEHLTKDQIIIILESNGTLNSEIYTLIESTFKDIIKTYDFNLEVFDIFYGPHSSTFQGSNDSLVLGYRFAEEDDSLFPSEEAWDQDYLRRYSILENLIPNLENEWSRVLNTNVSLIQYDDTCTLEHEQNKTATL